MAEKKIKNTAREALRDRITPLVKELMGSPISTFEWQLFDVLDEISEALDALDLGSTPEAFAPARPAAHRASDPAAIPRLRRRAVNYLDALAGNKGALKSVADALGITTGALAQWRKHYHKQSGTKLHTKGTSTGKQSTVKAGSHAEKWLLEIVRRDGKLYDRLQRRPKKGT